MFCDDYRCYTWRCVKITHIMHPPPPICNLHRIYALFWRKNGCFWAINTHRFPPYMSKSLKIPEIIGRWWWCDTWWKSGHKKHPKTPPVPPIYVEMCWKRCKIGLYLMPTFDENTDKIRPNNTLHHRYICQMWCKTSPNNHHPWCYKCWLGVGDRCVDRAVTKVTRRSFYIHFYL